MSAKNVHVLVGPSHVFWIVLWIVKLCIWPCFYPCEVIRCEWRMKCIFLTCYSKHAVFKVPFCSRFSRFKKKWFESETMNSFVTIFLPHALDELWNKIWNWRSRIVPVEKCIHINEWMMITDEWKYWEWPVTIVPFPLKLNSYLMYHKSLLDSVFTTMCITFTKWQ